MSYAFRRFPIGAEVIPGQGVHFRIWAGNHSDVDLVVEPRPNSDFMDTVKIEMDGETNGYFSILVPQVSHGCLYMFEIEHGKQLYPDPASRFQPKGPHGPSCVIDPFRYTWTDATWTGITEERQSIYEMHIGTFTNSGTFRSAADRLPALGELGVTVIQIMPVADFTGRFGWGYDGVNLFAPTRLYGEPDDFRFFVDRAHNEHLAVILDLVYNHFGPDGNYLAHFSESYFRKGNLNEWGDVINFDGPDSERVREFYTTNAAYWIEEFHLDGVRLDSVNNILDTSPEHVLVSITRQLRKSAGARKLLIVAENESQDSRYIRSYDQGGYGIDAVCNDDFHHSAMVVLSGRKEAYYTDYLGSPQEFVSCFKSGFLYQGQYYSWQKKTRGTPALDIDPGRFIYFLENHDQLANSLDGKRVHQICSPALYRAIMALTLLAPGITMIFQGQEFSAASPFLYFNDLPEPIRTSVNNGRSSFLSQFPTLVNAQKSGKMVDNSHEQSFKASKLNFDMRLSNAQSYRFFRDLLWLRRTDPVFSQELNLRIDGAVLGVSTFLIRYFADISERLFLVNTGIDHVLSPAPEPLLAPPVNSLWKIIWNSEEPDYGGQGIPGFAADERWIIPGRTTTVLGAVAKNNTEG